MNQAGSTPRSGFAQSEELSPVKRALLEIRGLRARIEEMTAAVGEPIAIVGAAIRTPGGVRSMEDFAGLLWSGTDAITPIPPDRWQVDAWYDEDANAPGKMYTREGGFLPEVDQFDAEFFGISPVEASSMDPQQRMVLELAWESLENAGLSPSTLAGTRAGVYLGIANSDYGRALLGNPELIDPYFTQGSAFSVASGRVAYFLGLQGPAISVDTACSSSLVSVHLACQGLRNRDCDLALAGGVNLILTPEINVNFCRAGMMSRDGRCKTFDAAADGYVRGEGGAVLVLRRLRDAQAGGDRILAVIRGTAVNQDGRSNGLTAPNGPAQEDVIRRALQAAEAEPADISYVETHGTGTSLGDPIEVNALGAVLSTGRSPEAPVAIGSVKTNIGHLESAAGIVGLAKALLVLERREVPPHLHLRTPNPYIDWASLPVIVPTEKYPLKAGRKPLLASVSSFGFSGTNAHVILQEPPAPPAEIPSDTPRLLALSARDGEALDALAASYIDLLDRRRPSASALADICFTASAGRAQFSSRVCVRGNNAADIADGLAAHRQGKALPGVVTGSASQARPRVAFLFPGQGPQYLGMGRELYEREPVFRRMFEECAAVLDDLLPAPLASVVFGGDPTKLDQTAFAQPAMFAMEVALASLWRSWGIEPSALLGHSFGEYAAACVAGVMSLQDGARMVAARGLLAQSLPSGGAMAVVGVEQAAVTAAIAQMGRQDISVAALNGAANTVISGAQDAVEALLARFSMEGARTKRLRVSQAFHSPLVEPILDDFEKQVARFSFSAPRISLVSSLLGCSVGEETLGSAQYWRRHLREPVRFAEGILTLKAMGITHFLEISPDPVLLGMGAEIGQEATWLPSLREGGECWAVIHESLQQLWCGGMPVAWDAVHHGAERRRVALPPYPFRRRRHWVDVASRASGNAGHDRWEALSRTMDSQASRGPLDLNAASYPAKWECLARLTAAHAVKVLRGAGLFSIPGESRTIDEVLLAAGIANTYRHLVKRWLAGLATRGALRVDGDQFVADRPLPASDLGRIWHEADLLFQDNRPLLDYVRNCGARLAAVLGGRESPLETLFPDGSFDLALGLYERSATMRYINGLAGAAVEALGAATSPGGVLRVLEIGAGTGGTTSTLLPLLPPERTRYVFTDVSEVFLSQARTRFANVPFIEFAIFDLDSDAESALARRTFDVIVSANCVHAVRDLRAAMGRLLRLLTPGGVLVLVESTVHMEYFDMTTGLIEGWQHFSDDLRNDNPLLPPSVWVEALREAGFVAADAWPGAESIASALGQHVILARAPGEMRPSSRHESTMGRDLGPPVASEGVHTDGDEWARRISEALPDERRDLFREKVREEVMGVLRLDIDARPSGNARLMDLGMDSLMAVQLRNRLNHLVVDGRALPSTLMFDYPTIDAIASFLMDRMGEGLKPIAENADSPAGSRDALGVAAIAAMSDAEIARLLDERLGKPR